MNPPYKGDIDVATFRRAAHRVADMAADYLESVHSYRVTPKVAPGEVRARIAASPPETYMVRPWPVGVRGEANPPPG